MNFYQLELLLHIILRLNSILIQYFKKEYLCHKILRELLCGNGNLRLKKTIELFCREMIY